MAGAHMRARTCVYKLGHVVGILVCLVVGGALVKFHPVFVHSIRLGYGA